MNLTELTLLVPDKADEERDAVCHVWTSCGTNVVRLARFWEPPDTLLPKTTRLYGNDTFCLVVAQKLGLSLVSPPDHLPKLVQRQWWCRDVDILTLANARIGAFPSFIKPLIPKQFAARVYNSAEELDEESKGLEASIEVLRSSIVTFEAEGRAFVLDGTVLDCAIYEGSADREAARSFAHSFCTAVTLPATCVVDVGLVRDEGWPSLRQTRLGVPV